MKKLLKIVAVLAAVLAVLLVAALITLKIMFPAEKIKSLAQDYVRNNFHRELTFSDVSVNIIGLTIKNVAVSERETFAQGTFFKADKAVIKLALKPLLRKRIEIRTIGLNGLDVYITKNEDGTFNFDDLMTESNKDKTTEPSASAEQDELGLVVLAEKMYARNCNIYYKDLQNGLNTSLTKINIEIKDFHLAAPFQVNIGFTTDYQDKVSRLAFTLPLIAKLTVDLASLNMQKAYVKLNTLDVSYNTIKFNLKGEVDNFLQPVMHFTGALSGVSNQSLAAFAADLPAFNLPTVNFDFDATADIETSVATLSKVKISMAQSNLSASGKVNWGEDQLTYTLASNLNLNLQQLAEMAQLKELGLSGNITGQITATEKKDFQDVNGTIELKQVAVKQDPVAISDVNGSVKIAWPQQISSQNITGLLNGEKFTSSFTYKDLGNVMDIVFTFDLSKLMLTSFTAAQAETQTQSPAGATDTANQADKSSTQTAEPEALFNVQAQVNIGEISVPYLASQGASLTAQLKKASPSMKQANGTVNFVLEQGAIKDLEFFALENKIIKILMFPIKIVRMVTSKLGIELFPVKKEEDKGKIKFSSGSGSYVFTNGVMTIQETHLDSAVSNIQATGNADFNTEKLDMRVRATVLTSQTPIIIKIGGTMSDPSGKLDVTQTAVSLVGGILNYKTPGKVATSAVKTTAATGQAVAGKAVKATTAVADTGTKAVKTTVDAAKGTVKAIGGLFKKKSDDDKQDSSENPAK